MSVSLTCKDAYTSMIICYSSTRFSVKRQPHQDSCETEKSSARLVIRDEPLKEGRLPTLISEA